MMSSEAEAGILGVLIWLPDYAAERLGKIDEKDFRDPRHRIIFEAVRRLHDDKTKADLAAVCEWLASNNQLEAAGGRLYLARLVDDACYNGAHRFESYVAVVKSVTGEEGEN